MTTVLAVAFGVFLLVTGIAHFAVPDYFARLVPPWLPQVRLLVHASGVLEVLLGVGVLLPTTRVLAAVAATGLMVVYVVTHLDALRLAEPNRVRWLDRPAGAAARVAVNLLYVVWAATIALTA